jgi:enoyl-CoA hydratase/carnithine racemase
MSAPAAPLVSVDVTDHVATVVIDNPPGNFFDVGMLTLLADCLHGLDEDPQCRAVVLAATGKHFCAGMNFATAQADDAGHTIERFYSQAVRIFQARKPIVAAVQGSAVGGGLGLACAADFRVADADSTFVANFARLGIHQGFGLSVTLPRIVGEQAAAELLYTGQRVKGEQAARIGLADRLAEPGQQRVVATELARRIAASAPLAVESIRHTLRGHLADEVQVALTRELAEQRRLLGTADAAEGITASLERRDPVFRRG